MPSRTPPQRARADSGDLLAGVAARVRARRQHLGLTLKELAERSGVSNRYLVELENGRGNISIGRLQQLALALDAPLVTLLAAGDDRVAQLVPRLAGLSPTALGRVEALVDTLTAPAPLVALLGVRGAGKSTVGRALATELGLDLVELDRLIEQAAGLTLEQLFSIHGEPYYRQVEHDVLRDLLASGRAAVLATGGSLVTHPETWTLLRRHSVTIWLRATARDHWERVIAQGDHRPMGDNPHAFAQLEALLAAREPLYELADHRLDTSGRTIDEVVGVARRLVQPASRSVGGPTGSPARRAKAVP